MQHRAEPITTAACAIAAPGASISGDTAAVEPCDLSAVDARRLIGSHHLSPRELLASCTARIEATNGTLNAFPTLDLEGAGAEAARQEAAVMRGEPLGPLHGLPIGIKDLQDVGGMRTTYGSPLFADHVPERDERIVRAVREAGALVIGKTNVPEWGAGANTRNTVTGATGNPFDPALNPGGSSGGSAAALATGMVPLATGSDTGGSLRNPASFCGVVGYRSSPGLVPMEGKTLGWASISVNGPMARTVDDVALLTSVIAGNDARDPFAGPVDGAAFRVLAPVDLASLRVAVSEDLGFAPVDPSVRAVFRDRVAAFGPLFRECATRTPWFEEADRTFEVIRAGLFLASYGTWYRESPQMLGPHIVTNVEQGLQFSLDDYAWAHRRHTEIYRRFQAFFDDVDLLICPAAAVTPFPGEISYPQSVEGVPARTYFHWLAINYGLTLTTSPVIALPCGVDRAGLPFGIQVVGPRGSDRFVLAAARELELAFAADPALRRPIPDLDRLRSAGKLS